MDDAQFGDRLRIALRQQGKTQADLCRELGFDAPYMSHLVHGQRYPSFMNLALILTCLPDIDARWLVTGVETKGGE